MGFDIDFADDHSEDLLFHIFVIPQEPGLLDLEIFDRPEDSLGAQLNREAVNTAGDGWVRDRSDTATSFGWL